VSYFINESNNGNVTASPDLVYHSSANTSSRLRARTQIMHDNTKEVSRKERQAELMRQRILSKQEMGSHLSSHLSTTPLEAEYKIEAYCSTEEYPKDMSLDEIYIDIEGQSVFAPINGIPIPFHISTIKNVVQPDPDRASTYLRLNFFSPGQSGKDMAPGTAQMMGKYGKSSIFVKEMLYCSHESRKLTAAHRMIQELRKRFRQHALKAAEEANLVAQEKLVSPVPISSNTEVRH